MASLAAEPGAASNGNSPLVMGTNTGLFTSADGGATWQALNGGGGLPQEQANSILSNLAQSTAIGIDGYPQRFGIPDGLYAEPVAVKQGWMCCWDGGNWMHLSTGVIGADRPVAGLLSALGAGDAIRACLSGVGGVPAGIAAR